jgi:hypothetical protein
MVSSGQKRVGAAMDVDGPNFSRYEHAEHFPIQQWLNWFLDHDKQQNRSQLAIPDFIRVTYVEHIF